MIPRLSAGQFERFTTSGRTSPALIACEDQNGKPFGEYVVKLGGPVGISGLLNELFAAKLATHFRLTTPAPAVVSLDSALAELIAATQPSKASTIRASVGLNFGSRYVKGSSPWPVDRSIPSTMWQAATDIFAFDALIQNPDRRFTNQNLLAVKDDLLIFDHEAAFSFLHAILPPPEPWKLENETYLKDHVFYRRLKSKTIDLERFMDSLSAVSEGTLANIAADVPAEWNNGNVAKIERHLLIMRDHAADFATAVQRFLK